MDGSKHKSQEEIELAESKATAFIFTKAKQDRVVWGDVVACKGVEDLDAIAKVHKHIKLLGYAEVILRSDCEPAILSFVSEVASRLRKMESGQSHRRFLVAIRRQMSQNQVYCS